MRNVFLGKKIRGKEKPEMKSQLMVAHLNFLSIALPAWEQEKNQRKEGGRKLPQNPGQGDGAWTAVSGMEMENWR